MVVVVMGVKTKVVSNRTWGMCLEMKKRRTRRTTRRMISILLKVCFAVNLGGAGRQCDD